MWDHSAGGMFLDRNKVALLVVDTAVANGDQDFEGFVKEQQTVCERGE